MPRRSVRVQGGDSESLSAGVDDIVAELDLPRVFPADVLAEAEAAVADPELPTLDRTDIAFITIDPAGSRDLDQALHIEPRGAGFRVHYAIADVAAFVRPGGAIDAEAQRRGQTMYAPDRRIPLHPPVLSEGAASLLPDQIRPALLWTLDLDGRGDQVKVNVERALVRSRAQLDYVGAQQQLDSGTGGEVLQLLRQVGLLRLERERERGGVSLPLPDQEVVVAADTWSLTYRRVLPVEEWNAQISLLTGMGAAEIMLYGETGIVRTLPAPPSSAVAKLRRTAAALGLEWPPEMDYPDFVRSIDPNSPSGAAMLNSCTSLLRGAGYVAFDGGVPPHVEHAAIASEYAHVTAPLRRLVDRYAAEVAVSLCADLDIPDWVRIALPDLPKLMEASDRTAHQFDRAVFDLVEAGVLESRVGDVFIGVVIEVDEKSPSKGSVLVQDPAVEARITSADGSPLPLGQQVRARLVTADRATRRVAFELA